MKLIVNADDFGLDELTTLAIDEAMGRGILTGTTLMVNMPYAKAAVALARAHGYFGNVGLHLNLTTGMPLTEAMRGSSFFCDAGGAFHGRWRKARRLRFTREQRALLQAEVAAQIDAFRGFEPLLIHMDSHHHVHAEWAFIGAVRDILREKGVRSIRISRNVRENAGLPYRMYKGLCNRRIRAVGAQTTRFFTDARDAALLMQYAQEAGVAEIMLHPRRDAENGPLLDRETGIEIAVRAIDALGMEKTSYAEMT